MTPKRRLIFQLVPRQDVTDSLLKKNQDPRLHHESSGEDVRMLGRKDARCKQGLVERCEDLHEQRCAVESEVQKDGGTLVLESCNS